MSLTIDFIMIPLLVAVMFYCWRLNQSIKVLRESGSDLEPVLRNFSAVISQVSQATEKLKTTSREVNIDFIQHLPKATALKDDLSFLLQHADQLTKRMDQCIENSKKIQRELEFSAQKAKIADGERHQVIPVKKEEILAKTQALESSRSTMLGTTPASAAMPKPQVIDRGLLSTLNNLR